MEFVYTSALATNSSTMQAIYWNEHTEELVVHFWAGSVIKYVGFDSDDYRAFAGALSKGRFYNSFVKGAFKGFKLDNDTTFKHYDDIVAGVPDEPKLLEAKLEAPINVTVNIYVNGDPEQIAKAVERLAPSVRAVQNWRG